jgi:uncharacterized protein (DUF362 family)
MSTDSQTGKGITNQPFEQKRFLVSKVMVNGNLRKTIKKSIDLIGGLESIVHSGDVVTLKPNLNTADPYPASSDPEFIKILSELIFDAGADQLRIIDSSTLYMSTRHVAKEIGLIKVAEEVGAQIIFLDEHEWVKQDFPKGRFLKSGSIGSPLKNLGKLILVPNLKAHRFAKYTGAMKLFVGWLRPLNRIRLHIRHLEEKIADLASFFNPDLIVMDARKCFVTRGPESGQVETPNLVLASRDMVTIDVEGIRIIQSYKAENKLKMDVWKVPQIRHAVDLGLGASSDADIHIIE